jgi:precorrin-2 dehydrogenase/sirohydrochlorin ferrochelatase
METFPAFYPLKGRRVVIAGDGGGAEAKARLFESAPAEVVRLTGREALDKGAYAGACLIFVASDDEAFLRAAAAAARASGAPVNVVDHPDLSDFHTPAVVDRGQVVAAIGTGGAAPLLASLLRAEIEAHVPEGIGRIAALLGDQREAVRAAFPDLAQRRDFLRAVLAGPVGDAASAGDLVLASRRLSTAIAGGWSAVGRVSFIEAPTEADLIGLRAMRALNTADVIVTGKGSAAILASHARRDAQRMTPRSASAPAIADLARAGRLVAVVGAVHDTALASRLGALGVAIEVLQAAPAS